MDYISDESLDISDSEIDDFEAQSYLHLKTGNVRVKISDNNYKCPFCVGKKKLVYQYKDLLQHATGVGVSNREGKVKAKHRALAKLLKNDFAETAGPSQQLEVIEQQPSLIVKQDDQYVWPWMGILVNVREGGARLKEHLVRFHPFRITPLWDVIHHIRLAVVEFNKDWTGFKDAMAFENHFEARHLGKRDWLESEHHGLDIFGWVARSIDFKSEDCIGEHLRKRGDLKTVIGLAMEESQKMDKLVAYLANQIQLKNETIQELECQYRRATMSLEKTSLLHQGCNEGAGPSCGYHSYLSVINMPAYAYVERLQNAEQGQIFCQICNMPNHTARRCPHRYDQTYQPEGIFQAMASISLSKSQHGVGPPDCSDVIQMIWCLDHDQSDETSDGDR